MQPKKNKAIQIPGNLHDSTLLCFLHPNRFESEEEKQAANLLHKICATNLSDFRESNRIEELILTEKERDIILVNEWNKSENKEVKARCNDLLCRYEIDKRKIKTETSNTYLSAYKEFGEVEFLIRAITIRDIKVINTDEFFQEILSLIHNKVIYPFWFNKLIDSLIKSYSIEKIKVLRNYIEEQRIKSISEKDFDKEREYIKALHTLKVFTKEELHKHNALSFENEADNITNNKKPDTFYPNLPDIYQNAYNEIFKIKKKEPLIFERIKEKLLKEKMVFMNMLSSFGVKIKFEVPESFVKDVEESIKHILISNFEDTIHIMLTIPFVSREEVNRYESLARKASPLFSSMFGSNHLDAKGNTIGAADPQTSLRTEAHVYNRQKRLYVIWTYVNLHHWSNISANEDFIFYYLKSQKPKFIEEDNLMLWARGITAGLNKDFITASHILMPQLEHTLHNIAEIKNGNITTLEKKRQESPTLGAILPKLKDVIKGEILFEIESFLQSGIDVNFRNNLSHGLFTPFEIDKYGIYLWWICLKLYFDKDIFENIPAHYELFRNL
jgi:hypothetical protein